MHCFRLSVLSFMAFFIYLQAALHAAAQMLGNLNYTSALPYILAFALNFESYFLVFIVTQPLYSCAKIHATTCSTQPSQHIYTLSCCRLRATVYLPLEPPFLIGVYTTFPWSAQDR